MLMVIDKIWHWFDVDGKTAKILLHITLNGNKYGLSLRPDIGKTNIEIFYTEEGWVTIQLACFTPDLTPENAASKLETWLNFL